MRLFIVSTCLLIAAGCSPFKKWQQRRQDRLERENLQLKTELKAVRVSFAAQESELKAATEALAETTKVLNQLRAQHADMIDTKDAHLGYVLRELEQRGDKATGAKLRAWIEERQVLTEKIAELEAQLSPKKK